MMTVLFIIYTLLVLFELVLILSFIIDFKVTEYPVHDDLPKVTVLVCARNEEHNISDCLKSIVQSDYPEGQFNILVGNDNSDDNTKEIIKSCEHKYPMIRALDIEHEKEGLIAKGNVLNQLVDASDTEYVVIIDADMVVTKDWLRRMVAELMAGYDMISGYTQILRPGKWAWIQYFDWQVVLHSMKSMADLYRPISILGNNMGFKRSSYDEVGGFRTLGPTDVEDLGLLQLFQREGFKTSQMVTRTGYAKTKPQQSFNDIIVQRCRWMNGVFVHHWLLAIPAVFARLWIIFAVVALFREVDLAIGIIIYGMTSSQLKFYFMELRSGARLSVYYYLEPIIISLLDTIALLRLMFVGKVSWKGRKH